MKEEKPCQKIGNHETIIRLLKWMKTKGYKSNKIITPANFTGCGRGMMAKCNIEKNSCIVSIPHDLLITTTLVKKSWFGLLLGEKSFNLSSREVLTLFLIYESHRGTDSSWHPYINTLPINYSLPINWKQVPTELPERFKDVFNNQIDTVKSSFKNVHQFVEYLETKKPCFDGVMTFERFVWAWCTVQTRGVHFKDKNLMDESDNYALAPFLDFFNHSPTADVSAKFCEDTKCYQIITHQTHSKGSQVFINYGTHDNLKLILNYGFYSVKNINSSVQFKLCELCDILNEMQLGNNLDKKLKLLKENKLFRDVSCRFGEVSWNFIVCARILVSSYEELQNWSRVFEGPISTRNEDLKTSLIKNCLKHRLGEVNHFIQPLKNNDNNFSLALIEEEANILTSCKFK